MSADAGRRYKVRGPDGEVEWVDHDELWRRQQEQTERLHDDHRRRRRLAGIAAAGTAGVLLVALLLVLVLRGREAPAPAAAPPSAPAAPSTASAEPPAGAVVAEGPAASGPAPGSAAAAATPEERVIAAVRDWAAAWRDQDLDAYLAAYSPRFRPADGWSRAGWERRRRRRVLRPASIELELGPIEVTPLGASAAEARFRQAYRSPDFADVVRKTLTLAEEAGEWRIVGEVAEPLVG